MSPCEEGFPTLAPRRNEGVTHKRNTLNLPPLPSRLVAPALKLVATVPVLHFLYHTLVAPLFGLPCPG